MSDIKLTSTSTINDHPLAETSPPEGFRFSNEDSPSGNICISTREAQDITSTAANEVFKGSSTPNPYTAKNQELEVLISNYIHLDIEAWKRWPIAERKEEAATLEAICTRLKTEKNQACPGNVLTQAKLWEALANGYEACFNYKKTKQAIEGQLNILSPLYCLQEEDDLDIQQYHASACKRLADISSLFYSEISNYNHQHVSTICAYYTEAINFFENFYKQENERSIEYDYDLAPSTQIPRVPQNEFHLLSLKCDYYSFQLRAWASSLVNDQYEHINCNSFHAAEDCFNKSRESGYLTGSQYYANLIILTTIKIKMSSHTFDTQECLSKTQGGDLGPMAQLSAYRQKYQPFLSETNDRTTHMQHAWTYALSFLLLGDYQAASTAAHMGLDTSKYSQHTNETFAFHCYRIKLYELALRAAQKFLNI